MSFNVDDRQTSCSPRVNDCLILGNLCLNKIARSKGVLFKLKNPYEKRAKERKTNPNFKGYSRTFKFFNKEEGNVVMTDNGIIGIAYDTSLFSNPDVDVTKYDLRVSFLAAVIIVGYDM